VDTSPPIRELWRALERSDVCKCQLPLQQQVKLSAFTNVYARLHALTENRAADCGGVNTLKRKSFA